MFTVYAQGQAPASQRQAEKAECQTTRMTAGDVTGALQNVGASDKSHLTWINVHYVTTYASSQLSTEHRVKH